MVDRDDLMPNDDIEVLYHGVIIKLKAGETLNFEVDELIDVYDYATDVGDNWVCGEVMNYLLQLDSALEPMLERKSMRLLIMGEGVGAAAVAAKLGENSFIKHLVFAWLSWESHNWRESYTKLLSACKQKSLYDYETTALETLALNIDDITHLASIIDDITPLCVYPETFMANVADALRAEERYDDAVKLYVKLTELNPFSVAYWEALADIYLNFLDNQDEGVAALEYALALEPNSAIALRIQGDLLLRQEAPAEKLHELADQMISLEIYPEGRALKVMAFLSEAKFDEGADLMLTIARDFQNPILNYLTLLELNLSTEKRELVEKELNEFLACDADDHLLNWVSDAVEDKFDVSESQLEMLSKSIIKSELKLSDAEFSSLLVLLSKFGKFKPIVDVCEHHENQGGTLSVDDTALYVMSMLSLGLKPQQMRDKFERLYEELCNNYQPLTTKDVVYHSGMSHLLKMVRFVSDTLLGKSGSSDV